MLIVGEVCGKRRNDPYVCRLCMYLGCVWCISAVEMSKSGQKKNTRKGHLFCIFLKPYLFFLRMAM